jgi:hypothetical protein
MFGCPRVDLILSLELILTMLGSAVKRKNDFEWIEVTYVWYIHGKNESNNKFKCENQSRIISYHF